MWQVNKHPFIKSGLLTGFLLLNLTGPQAYAARTDQNFREYLRFQCQNSIEFVTPTKNFILCTSLFAGDYAISAKGRDNIIIPTGGDTGQKNNVRPDFQGAGFSGSSTVSAGAEDGGLGYMVTMLSGDTQRIATENENSFASNMSGYALGIDYQLSDFMVAGLILSSTEDDASVANGMGSLQTGSEARTLYLTVMPMDNLSLDVYAGNGDADIDSRRAIQMFALGNIVGIASGSFKNSQDFQGASINYDLNLGAWSIGVLAAADKFDTEIDGYSEDGSTGAELRFPDQTVKSATTSTGLRSSYVFDFDWGTLMPNLKFVNVEEDENNARTFDIQMAASGSDVDPFRIHTDAPDRKYGIESIGLVLAFNGIGQLYMNCEKRSGHDFIKDTSATMGMLLEF